jgi:type II secretory pathway pseudopilin PulG
VILVTVTLLLCAIIILAAAGVAPSSVIAQQQEEDTSLGERENIARGIISNVLGGGSNNDDSNNEDDEENNGAAAAGDRDGDINRQTAVPIINQDQDQEQEAANLALNEALDLTVVEPISPPSPTSPPSSGNDGGLEPECSLEITTDKENYGPGDVVAITITNTGDVPIEFPDSFLGLQIKNVDTGQVFPLDAQPVIVTFEPGASATFQFTYEELVSEIGAGLISATVPSQCDTVEEVTFTLTAPPPPEEIVEKIAFRKAIADWDKGRVYVMNADGSEQTELTDVAGYWVFPDWSPDGTKIAFSSARDNPGAPEIFVMNADGSDQTKLTNNRCCVVNDQPDWGPATDT